MENREVWRGRVEEWRASGQGPADYCRGKSFTPSGLAYWVKKFEAETSPKGAKSPRIARVVRSSVGAAKAKSARPSGASASGVTGSSMVIEVGAMRVEVPPTIDAEHLEAMLVAVVRAAAQGGAA